MSKSRKQKALEGKIKSLGSNIKTTEELEELTRLLRKTTLEAMLGGEMDDHRGYARHSTQGHHSGNSRNGYSSKTLKGEHGISANLLYRWRGEEHQAHRLGTTRTALKAEHEDLIRLRRELDTVRKERDFLKSAAAYFARERK